MLRKGDMFQWPDPVGFGDIEAPGKPSDTISVHIPIYLNGKRKRKTLFKLLTSGETFQDLVEGWAHVSERRLGRLALLAILAGSGSAGAAPTENWPEGIGVEAPIVSRNVSKKSRRRVSVRLPIALNGKMRCLKFIAKREEFHTLASFHDGDELSDSRFGYLLRIALWTGHAKFIQPRPGQGGGRRKHLQRCAWKTASWLGPALLPPMHDALQGKTESALAIVKAMKKEARALKVTPRAMAAFLIWKNWRNSGRLEWPSKITPIEMDGLSQSGSFWDEVFYCQSKLKKFPWAKLREENPERFDELTRAGIEQMKAARKNFDWSRFERENPQKFGHAIEEFRQSYTRLNQFRQRVELPSAVAVGLPKATQKDLISNATTGTFWIDVPIQGPYSLLPKPFEEVVTDILENRAHFILLPD